MASRNGRTPITTPDSDTGTSTKTKRGLISNLLNLIRRNKTDKKKKDKAGNEEQDIETLKEGVSGLKERFNCLEQHFKLLMNESDIVVKQNKVLCNEITNTRKEAEIRSEKLMLFIMTFMQKIKNNYKFNVTNEEGRNYNYDELIKFNVNLEYAKKELDSYFEKLQNEYAKNGSLVSMLDQYLECKRENNPHLNIKNKAFVRDKNMDRIDLFRDDMCLHHKKPEDKGFRKLNDKER